MSDTTSTDKTLRVGTRKPLSLKRDTDTVRQSFSGGRSKAVVVEKKRSRVAGPAKGCSTEQQQVLDVVGQRRKRYVGLDRVDALVEVFDDRIAGGLDDIRVVAQTAGEIVMTGSAIEQHVLGRWGASSGLDQATGFAAAIRAGAHVGAGAP